MKIFKTAKFSKLSAKIFIGNCVNGLNDKYFQDNLASDATDLAYIVENGQQINEQQFAAIVEPLYKGNQKPDGNYSYYYNSDRDVAWFYDENEDIEYFYK